MSFTLKIMTDNEIRWITGVSQIVELREFNIPKGLGVDVYSSIFPDPETRPGDGVTIVGLISKENYEQTGMLLKVERNIPDCQTQSRWENIAVPRRSCYILSESGKTVDRI